MNISPAQSGYQLIQQSNRLTQQAANDINDQTTRPLNNTAQNGRTNGNDPLNSQQDAAVSTLPQSLTDMSEQTKQKDDLVEPLVNLQRASQYSKVGTNIIQREQQMIGSLLDTSV